VSQTKASFAFNSKLYDPKTGRKINSTPIDGVVKPSSANSRGTHLKRQAQKSKTLMRRGLQKPKSAIKAAGKSASHHAAAMEFTKKVSRAKKIGKSDLIQKFASANSDIRPAKKGRAQHMPQAPGKDQVARQAQPDKPDFEGAIDKAVSHLEKPPKRTGRKISAKSKKLSIGLFAGAAIVLAGFFTWQNTLQLQMRLAAAKAGVPASLPKYSPAGYSASNDIETEPGKVSVSYKSKVDGKEFNISQQSSEWTNETLHDKHVLSNNKPYQTYQESGKTVYLLDDSGATWVDNGVWYQIKGEADLTSDQMLRIADSL
jgi:hypothetical protein